VNFQPCSGSFGRASAKLEEESEGSCLGSWGGPEDSCPEKAKAEILDNIF